eukprot:SM000116S24250  [mRNA]  locus=s116:328674:336186:+ [translate_table: standard]
MGDVRAEGGGRRGKRGRTQRRDFRTGRRENVWKRPRGDGGNGGGGGGGGGNGQPQGGTWEGFVYDNEHFEAYYKVGPPRWTVRPECCPLRPMVWLKAQAIVPEGEWDAFMAILRVPLPATFRINGSGKFALGIRDQIQRDFLQEFKEGLQVDGVDMEPPYSLPWYSNDLAWHLSYSRMQLRRLPVLERFAPLAEWLHEFLKRENELGSITRQEAVSMVPPLFLDVQPHHKVLDMCAAPGSKTFQLLEMLHKSDDLSAVPEGVVIANDVDVQRCHLLVHQTKRMNSPAIIVTNHEAQHLPSLKPTGSKSAAVAAGTSGMQEGKTEEEGLFFDRILCDVPCSGDGTLRKAPDIWRKWNVGVGNGLHPLQVRIAVRGIALLKVGGRLIYSTCSLNPIENEAVVAQVLRETRGCVELLDVTSELRQLKRIGGVKSWRVKDKKQWYSSYSEVNPHRAGSILPSHFPTGRGHHQDPATDAHETPESMSNVKLPDGASPSIVAASVVSDTASTNGEIKQMYTVAEAASLPEEGTARSDATANGANGPGRAETLSPAESTDLPLERCIRILPHMQDTGGFFIAVFVKVAPYRVVHHPRAERRRKTGPRDRPTRFAGDNVPVGREKLRAAATDADQGTGFQEDEADTGAGFQEDGLQTLTEEDPIQDMDSAEQSVLECEDRKVAEDWEEPGGGEEAEAAVDSIQGEEAVHDGDGDTLEEGGENLLETEDAGKDLAAKVEDAEQAAATFLAPTHARRIQQQGRWKGVDPVLFLEDGEVLANLISYYGILDTLPLKGRLVCRSDDVQRMKRLYYVSSSVADVIRLNSSTGNQLKFTSAGIKLFERQSVKDGTVKCPFRITSEGLPIVLPHLSRQILMCTPRDFRHLLTRRSVQLGMFQAPALVEALRGVDYGCCIFALDDGFKPPSTAVGVWRGKNNVAILLTKQEAAQMLERLHLPEEGRRSLSLKLTACNFQWVVDLLMVKEKKVAMLQEDSKCTLQDHALTTERAVQEEAKPPHPVEAQEPFRTIAPEDDKTSCQLAEGVLVSSLLDSADDNGVSSAKLEAEIHETHSEHCLPISDHVTKGKLEDHVQSVTSRRTDNGYASSVVALLSLKSSRQRRYLSIHWVSSELRNGSEKSNSIVILLGQISSTTILQLSRHIATFSYKRCCHCAASHEHSPWRDMPILEVHLPHCFCRSFRHNM